MSRIHPSSSLNAYEQRSIRCCYFLIVADHLGETEGEVEEGILVGCRRQDGTRFGIAWRQLKLVVIDGEHPLTDVLHDNAVPRGKVQPPTPRCFKGDAVTQGLADFEVIEPGLVGEHEVPVATAQPTWRDTEVSAIAESDGCVEARAVNPAERVRKGGSTLCAQSGQGAVTGYEAGLQWAKRNEEQLAHNSEDGNRKCSNPHRARDMRQ